MDGLEVDGDVVDGGEEAAGKDESKGAHDPVGALPGESRRNHGSLALEVLKGSPSCRDGDKANEKANDNRRVPGVGNTAILHSKDVSDGGAHHQDNTERVHLQELFQESCLDGDSTLGRLEEDQYNQGGETSDGEVDVETPSPADVVGECAAQKRTNDTGKSIRSTEDAGKGRPLLGRSRKGDDGISASSETSGADTSNRASSNEGLCAGGSTAND